MTAEEEKQDLVQLVQALDPPAVQAPRPIARLLSHQRELEFDEEELRPEFAAKLQRAQEAFARGEPGIPHEEILREFGL